MAILAMAHAFQPHQRSFGQLQGEQEEGVTNEGKRKTDRSKLQLTSRMYKYASSRDHVLEKGGSSVHIDATFMGAGRVITCQLFHYVKMGLGCTKCG